MRLPHLANPRGAGRAPALASLCYAVLNPLFRREHHAVLAGQSRYRLDLAQPHGSSALLRRNIHRIEKGLLMRPRRDVFAVEYLEETLRTYERMLLATSDNDVEEAIELRWAHDVLSAYFEATASHPVIDPQRARFRTLPQPKPCCGGPLVPYRRDLSGCPPVGIEDLEKLAKRRRSVRWFLPKAVPRAMIDRAVAVAAQSPSACNRQPFVFRIFDEPQLVRRLSAVPMGTSGYADNIPVIVAVVGQLRHYAHERDRHLIYIDGALASMALLLALEAQGLSSCCINWPEIDDKEREISEALHLEADERVVLLIALGYPDPEGSVAQSAKKPLSQIRSYNFEPLP